MGDISCYSDVLGQPRAVKLMGRTLEKGRIPHALLFRGPEGVGKVLFARGVAAAVNCRQQGPAKACGSCNSCRKYASRSHPDFLLIQPEKGAIKIDQVRQLKRELGYPPYESPYRVVVLEDVHTMRREAANSLLKVLEEPPANNVLILTAEASAEVLPTIVSRCQPIAFAPLPVAVIESLLTARDISPEKAGRLAKLADGSMSRALVYEQSEVLVVWEQVTALLAQPDAASDKRLGDLLLAAERMAALKDEIGALLELFRVWVKELLLAVVPAAHQDKSWSSAALFAKLQAINQAERELARNCNRSLVCEVLLFRLL